MAGHPQRVHPKTGCSFVVARPFDHGDLPFMAGDPFPFRELGLHEAHAVQLWHACYLEVAPPKPRSSKRK